MTIDIPNIVLKCINLRPPKASISIKSQPLESSVLDKFAANKIAESVIGNIGYVSTGKCFRASTPRKLGVV